MMDGTNSMTWQMGRVWLVLMTLHMVLGHEQSAIIRRSDVATESDLKQQTLLTLREARELNKVEDVDELCKLYVDGKCVHVPSDTDVMYDEVDNSVPNKVETPKPAKCQPELMTVMLPVSEDPSLVFQPSCTRLMRCGGCCNQGLLSCKPTPDGVKSHDIQLSVLKRDRRSKNLMRQPMKHIVTVEEHTKCECTCKLQQKDCHRLQHFNKSSCRCVCTNVTDKQKCQIDGTKYWREETCDCHCHNVIECTTGHYFDKKTCNCHLL